MVAYCVFGGPASGKDTHSNILAEELAAQLGIAKEEIPVVSMGDLLREKRAKDEAFDALAKSYMSIGQLVPDDIATGVLEDHIIAKNLQEKDFVLNGYPRNPEQKKLLDAMLEKRGIKLEGIIYLDAPEEELWKRMGTRVVETQEAKANGSTVTANGVKATDREDDGDHQDERIRQAFSTRIGLFKTEALAALNEYRKEGNIPIYDVDASGSKEQTAIRMLDALDIKPAGQYPGGRVLKTHRHGLRERMSGGAADRTPDILL